MEEKWDKMIQECEFTVHSRCRARGAWLLETDCGLKLMQDMSLPEEHFAFCNRVKQYVYERGMHLVDRAYCWGELEPGEKYAIYDWFQGGECDWRRDRDLASAASNLGRFHRITSQMLLPEEGKPPSDIVLDMERHNREMKRIYSYIRTKKKENEFERFSLTCFPDFYRDAKEVSHGIASLEYYQRTRENVKTICHGEYNYHNVIMTTAGVATTHFEHVSIDRPVMDLYYFMRKCMEKCNWNLSKGTSILKAYEEERPLEVGEKRLLGLLLLYPEKYWKVMNQYYNKKKSWMSARSIDKLIGIREQYPGRRMFIQTIFNQ